jgi:hypothetical protein
MRKFDSQLHKVYFSVNTKGTTLRKRLNILEKVNPTEMGVRLASAERISKEDRRFKYKVWDPPMKHHGFLYYVDDGYGSGEPNPQFTAMLEEMGIDVKSKR